MMANEVTLTLERYHQLLEAWENREKIEISRNHYFNGSSSWSVSYSGKDEAINILIKDFEDARSENLDEKNAKIKYLEDQLGILKSRKWFKRLF